MLLLVVWFSSAKKSSYISKLHCITGVGGKLNRMTEKTMNQRRRMSLEEHAPPFTPDLWCLCCSIFRFLYSVLQIIVCLVYFPFQ